jgi:flagellar biosynthesis chaperone FliJ
MTEGKAGFPRTQNGYSPQHVDDFIVALAQRAKTQISTLEQRVADVQANAAASSCVELEEQIAKLERGIADRDAQLSEARARMAILQQRISELEAGRRRRSRRSDRRGAPGLGGFGDRAQLVPGVDRRTACQGGTSPPPQAAERLHARGLTGVSPDLQIAHESSMRRR